MTATPSPVQQLTDRLRDRLVDRFALREVGEPYARLTAPATGEPVGTVRVWTGPLVPKLVDSRLVLPGRGIDSVMLHAFAPEDSACPHLGSDIAGLGSALHCNVDLAPRVDLSLEPPYVEAVYEPLTPARAAAHAIDDATPTEIPLRLLASSSPWITGVRVPEAALDTVGEVFEAYVDRFADLVERGTPAVDDRELAAKDTARRRARFDPASDVVWDLLVTLVGAGSTDLILDLLREPGPPAAP